MTAAVAPAKEPKAKRPPKIKAKDKPFGPFERMLAIRYLRAKREHGGLALISIVSVIGITLAVMALIIIMSVMNGFRIELISKILGFQPHMYVSTAGMDRQEADLLVRRLQAEPGVTSVEPMVEATALAAGSLGSDGVQVRGIRPEDLRGNQLIRTGMGKLAEQRALPDAVTPEQKAADALLSVGSLEQFGTDEENSNHVVVGASLAQDLGLVVGSTVKLTQVNGPSTPMGGRATRSRVYTVVALFHVGNELYDRHTIFMPLPSAENFFGYDYGYPIIGLRISDPDNAGAMKTELTSKGYPRSETWIERSGNYFTALVVERNVMRLIMMIVVAITSLNIITGVLMLVKNKARDIAILRTIGATRAGVVRIFIMTGSMLGSVGVLTGLTFGLLFCLNIAPIQHFLENLFHFRLFPPDVYMLDALPAVVEPGEVVFVAISAFIMAVATTLIPSMWASRLDPVDALRFQ
jgi:lipoprotein-releasing system permease protein